MIYQRNRNRLQNSFVRRLIIIWLNTTNIATIALKENKREDRFKKKRVLTHYNRTVYFYLFPVESSFYMPYRHAGFMYVLHIFLIFV